jgi:callose synthase
VGLNQISLFEAKIACGNGEQALSRDIYRLGHRFDFFRMLSAYFTTVGYYFSTIVSILTMTTIAEVVLKYVKSSALS